MKKLCIYHAGCADGFGAAYVVWKKFGDEVDFFPGRYQQPAPDIKGRDVIIVDFSYKRADMEKIIEGCKSLLLLDHHKSAEEDLTGLSGGNEISIRFRQEHSGAMLAWLHFFPDQAAPDLIKYIEDRDLWKKQMPHTEEVSAALRSYPQDFLIWDGLFKKPISSLIEEGSGILRAYRQNVDAIKKYAYRITIAGHDVPICNAPWYMASEVAGELAEGNFFAATYYDANDKFIFSLRSRNDGLDVSEIAKRWGGGGHRNAAGFSIPKPKINYIEELLK